MPGNEVGDRVHNFFGQENLSQGQYHSQAVDGNWPGLSNNLWAGSQRPAGGPYISNLKNFNLQQSDSEQGHTGALHLRHGLNLSQSNQRPDIGRNQTPNQHAAVNGYMQGHQVFQTRQNEANILGVDTGADLHGISNLSRGITVLESQQGAGLDQYKKNLTRTDATESPVNYDFFGGQQQTSSRQSGMLQSFPRQQPGINDIQLLQQQAMLHQMQELQRQQQFHQLEARQQSSMTPASSISKQAATNHSASLFNGIPINEASNLMWQPEVMATNANWLQRGAPPVMQGSPNGFVLSPEQLRLMGLVPNQGDQSLYGLPISGSRGAPSSYSHVQADKLAMSQVSTQNQYSHVQGDKQSLPSISASANAFPVHQYAAMSDQTNSNDGTSVSRQDIQGRNMFGSVAQGLNSGLNMENLQQMNSEQRDVPMEDFHARQELAGSSENSQDKMLVQVPPHNVATLDPTEEKILFGSDDNPWDGFGKNSGFSMLDDSDGFSGFPSLQSGSWSALMQSAVAETSSSEVGIQEEWSGLSSKPLIRQDDLSRPTSTVNYSGLPGFHRPGADTAQEQHNRLHADSSQRPIPQILERGKWLDCSPQQKPVAEGSHNYGNEKVISGSWNHQQTLSSPNRSSEPFNRSNGWNYIKSSPPDNNPTPKTRENVNVFQPHRDMGQVPTTWEPDSDSSVVSEHVKSAGNMQLSGEDSGMNGMLAMQNSGATWVSRPNNHQHSNVDTWRHADSVGSYGGRNEGSGKFRPHMEKNPLVLESLKNEKSEGETYDMENSNKKDKSADGIESNLSYQRTSGVRENPSFDGSDLHSPKLPGQGNRRPPVARKFQYHPMGDIGVETESYGNKHVVNSQPMPNQPFGGLTGRDQSYPYGHSDGNYTETEKGDKNSFDNNASKGELSSHAPNTLMPFDRNVGNYASNKTASPSQNILELLHKVDQSREHGIATNTSTSNCHLSSRVMDTEPSNGSIVHPQRNQSSSSQGFGLQLAPPTQMLPMASSHATPHAASEMVDKGHTWLADTQAFPSRESSHEIRNNIADSSGQVFDKASQYSALGNTQQAFTSGFPFSRIHAQNQNMASLGGQVANTHCDSATRIDRMASANQIDEYGERTQTSQSAVSPAQDLPKLSGINQIRPGDPTVQISALEAGTTPHPSVTFNASLHGTQSKVLHNVWTSVSGMQQPNALNASSHPQPVNICETETGPQKPQIEDSENDANDLSRKQMLPEVGDGAEETASASGMKEHIVKSTPDASQSSQAATSRDIEDFGRSLRPNTFSHPNFSMLNQVQSMKNMEINPIDQDVNKFKVSDDVGDRQFDSNHGQRSYGYNNTVENVSGDNSSAPGDGRETNASSEEVVGYGQKNALNVANSNKITSLRSDHSLINPQMAPSWFEQYGTFKNGKMLPMYDARTMTPKIMDQPFIVKSQAASSHLGNSMEQVNSLHEAGQQGHVRLSPMPTSVASVNVPSQLLSPPAIEPDLRIVRPKKRKSDTSELIAWHEELKQGSERLPDIRAAELDWAQAANRLIEKVEDDAELVEVLPTMKSKRRLVLTTQLMQQLLIPPPAAVLSEDVKLHYDSVVYSVARLVLGDGCSSASLCGSDTPVPPASKNPLPNKLKSSDKIDQYILKVEDYSDRARKLENDMLRWESRASILDLRIECQDLEKFSVINRFAKFHGRGQNDGAESSSSSEATANAQKSFLQKYVAAVPMPRNLPDRVQCLSL
ncbi:dentin sialophosphoprotein [Trifolium repens]|nr:dentin sialophosphoprotein [Trifolium repens]